MLNGILISGVGGALAAAIGMNAYWSARYDGREAELLTAATAMADHVKYLEKWHDKTLAVEGAAYKQRIAVADGSTQRLLRELAERDSVAQPQGTSGDPGAAGGAGGDLVMSPGEASVWISRGADRDLAALALCRNTVVNPVQAE